VQVPCPPPPAGLPNLAELQKVTDEALDAKLEIYVKAHRAHIRLAELSRAARTQHRSRAVAHYIAEASVSSTGVDEQGADDSEPEVEQDNSFEGHGQLMFCRGHTCRLRGECLPR
jgi:hypothetical protein